MTRSRAVFMLWALSTVGLLTYGGLVWGQTTQSANCLQPQASLATTGGRVCAGTGTPEAAVTGWIGDLFLRRDGSTGTALYIKESGANTNTGWRATGTTVHTTHTVGGGTVTATAGGTLTTSVTQLCTTAVITEETLWTYTLPAATLAADGRGVRVTVFGTTGATANAKTVRVYFGATLLQNYAGGTANNLSWRFDGTVFRTGATAQLGSNNMIVGSSNLGNILAVPAETLSGTVVIKMTGQNGVAAANDICFRGAMVEGI